MQHFFFILLYSISDIENLPTFRDGRKKDITPHPSSSSRSFWKWFSLLYNLQCEVVFRDDDKVLYLVAFRIIEEEKIRIIIALQSINHGRVCSIGYLVSKCRSRLEFIIFITILTVKICDRFIIVIVKNWISTTRAEDIFPRPKLGHNSRFLRITCVSKSLICIEKNHILEMKYYFLHFFHTHHPPNNTTKTMTKYTAKFVYFSASTPRYA